MALEISVDGAPGREVVLARGDQRTTVWIDGRPHRARLRPAGAGFELALDDRAERMWVVVDRDVVHVHAFGRAWRLDIVDPVERARQAAEQADLASAPMPGTVVAVPVGAGERVTAGQPLVVIESMKMQSEIVASRDGVVERVHLQVGDSFDRGAPLVTLEGETGG